MVVSFLLSFINLFTWYQQERSIAIRLRYIAIRISLFTQVSLHLKHNQVESGYLYFYELYQDALLVVGFAMTSGKRNCISDISEASGKENHKVEP